MFFLVAIRLRQPPALGVVGADIFGDGLGMRQFLAQAFEYQRLDGLARDLAAVRAGAAVTKARAVPFGVRAERSW